MAEVVSSMSVTINTAWVDDMKAKDVDCKKILSEMCEKHEVTLSNGDNIQFTVKGKYESIKKMKMALEEWHKEQIAKGNAKERNGDRQEEVNGTETGEEQRPQEEENKPNKRQRKLKVNTGNIEQIENENIISNYPEQMAIQNIKQASSPSFEETRVTDSGSSPLNVPAGATAEDEKYDQSTTDTWPDQNQAQQRSDVQGLEQNFTGSSLSAVELDDYPSDVQMAICQPDNPSSPQIGHQQILPQHGPLPSPEVPWNMQQSSAPVGQKGQAIGFQGHTQQPNHPNGQYHGYGHGQGQQQYPGSYQSGTSSVPQGQVCQAAWNPVSGQNVGWQPMSCPSPPNPNSHSYSESTSQFRLAQESNDSLYIVSNRPHNVLRISIYMGNIASTQCTPIIVSSSNRWLSGHDSISNAVLSAAGPPVIDYCHQLVAQHGPFPTGEIISTGPGNLYLRVETILHTVIPTMEEYRRETNSELDNLWRAFHRCLGISTQQRKSMSIPPLGSGIFGLNKTIEAFVQALKMFDEDLAQQPPADGPTPNEINFISNDSRHLQTMMYYVKNLLFPPLA